MRTSEWGRAGGLPVSVAYLERRKRIESMEEIKRAIDVAEKVPFRYLILHLGLAGKSSTWPSLMPLSRRLSI